MPCLIDDFQGTYCPFSDRRHHRWPMQFGARESVAASSGVLTSLAVIIDDEYWSKPERCNDISSRSDSTPIVKEMRHR